MGLHGNSGTFIVTTGAFVGAQRTTLADRGFLVNVSLVSGGTTSTVFSVVTYLSISDEGAGPLILRLHDLCGDVSGTAGYDAGTNGLDFEGRIPLGNTRNELQFFINNDSGSTITAVWGWVSVDA